VIFFWERLKGILPRSVSFMTFKDYYTIAVYGLFGEYTMGALEYLNRNGSKSRILLPSCRFQYATNDVFIFVSLCVLYGSWSSTQRQQTEPIIYCSQSLVHTKDFFPLHVSVSSVHCHGLSLEIRIMSTIA
jgi:hypothetical protein